MTAEEIKTIVSISDLVGRFGVELKGNKARCPFHEDNTPSFSVSPKRKIFKCFGCGVSGDIFTFVELAEGCSFKQAKQIICTMYGLDGRIPKGYRAKMQREMKRREELKAWRSGALDVLSSVRKRADNIGYEIAEKGFTDDIIYIMQNSSRHEAMWDALFGAETDEDIKKLYPQICEEVRLLDRKYNARPGA